MFLEKLVQENIETRFSRLMPLLNFRFCSLQPPRDDSKRPTNMAATSRRIQVNKPIRSRRRRVDDYDQATQFLQHFHSVASRSLDVIFEEEDNDDENSSRQRKNSLVKKTQTFACLTSLSMIADAHNTHNLSCFPDESSDSSDDCDEWGYYDLDVPSERSKTLTAHGHHQH